MGISKKKRDAKRRKHLKNRNLIREKMGKPVFFTLTHCSKKLRGTSNKYNYKANMHKLCFVDSRFYNVKYQASIITDCNFRNASIIGVDFFNCNMRGTSLKNAKLENVVFYNCNLKNVDFSGTSFSNVTFICTNLQVTNNLNIDDPEIRVMRTYKPLDLNESVKLGLLELANNESLFHAKVLHVNKGKLNNWALNLILLKHGDRGIEMLEKVLHKKEQWDNMYTVFSYILLIENMKKK